MNEKRFGYRVLVRVRQRADLGYGLLKELGHLKIITPGWQKPSS